MKRLMFACSVAFAFGAMCGMPSDEDATEEEEEEEEVEPEKEVVVVPVPGGLDEDAWCCQYEDDEVQKFALTEGPSECADRFGDQNGSWVQSVQCTPCCCKSPNEAGSGRKGNSFELTTPGLCSATGECLIGSAKQCATGEEPEDDKGDGDHTRKPHDRHPPKTERGIKRDPTQQPAPKKGGGKKGGGKKGGKKGK